MNNNFIGLAHIAIYTEDITKSKQFYIENLGFKLKSEVVLEKPNNQSLKISFIDLNGMVIELLESSDKSIIRKGNSGSVEHFAIQVENLGLIVDELLKKGIIFETLKPLHNEKLRAQMIFLKGPSEERIELFEYMN